MEKTPQISGHAFPFQSLRPAFPTERTILEDTKVQLQPRAPGGPCWDDSSGGYGGDSMGPESPYPNQTGELQPHGPPEGAGDCSNEEPEEEGEAPGAGPAGASCQLLAQDPEPGEAELVLWGGEDALLPARTGCRFQGFTCRTPH